MIHPINFSYLFSIIYMPRLWIISCFTRRAVIVMSGFRWQRSEDRRQKTETGNLASSDFPYFEYRISNKEFWMMKFYFPSIFNILYSIFCGSLFSDIWLMTSETTTLNLSTVNLWTSKLTWHLTPRFINYLRNATLAFSPVEIIKKDLAEYIHKVVLSGFP